MTIQISLKVERQQRIEQKLLNKYSQQMRSRQSYFKWAARKIIDEAFSIFISRIREFIL